MNGRMPSYSHVKHATRDGADDDLVVRVLRDIKAKCDDDDER